MNNNNEPELKSGNSQFVRQPIQSLHTLDGDILSSIKDENYASNIVKVVTQHTDAKGKENDENKEDFMNPTGQKPAASFRINLNSPYFYVVVSIIFLSVVGGAAYFAVTSTIQQTLPSPAVATSTPAASSTLPANISITQKNIFNAEVIVPVQLNALTKIQIISLLQDTKKSLLDNELKDNINVSLSTDVDLITFLNKIQYSGPETLVRSISSDKVYNFGVYHKKKDDFDTYLITKIDSFDLAFSGMLEWERTLPVDLSSIFTYMPEIVEQSTSTPQTVQNVPRFVDKVVKNIDVRSYIDPVKGTQIMYGFVNKKYLVITSGEAAFADIINKLTVNNILR